MSLRCVIGWHSFKIAAHQRRDGLSVECCRCRRRLRVRGASETETERAEAR